MKNLLGTTWGQLTKIKKEEMLSIATTMDATDGTKGSGKVIVDFNTNLSIEGFVEEIGDEDVISISDDAIFY